MTQQPNPIQKIIMNNSVPTKKEERELIKKAQDGDEDARDEMITRNLGLVAKNVRYYMQYTNVGFDDLLQEGTLGLFTAINKFDLNKEWRFSTYATWWIRHHIGRYMTNHGRTIRIPSRIIDLKRLYSNEREEYMREFGEEPSRSEIAALLNVSEDKVDEMLIYSAPVSSLDYSVKNNNGGGFNAELGTMADLIEDKSVDLENDLIRNDIMAQLSEALAHLEPVEQMAILRFYNIGQSSDVKRPTKTHIVEEMGLRNINHFNAILHSGMEKLKAHMSSIDNIDGLFE